MKRIILYATIAMITILALSGCAFKPEGNEAVTATTEETIKELKSITVTAQGIVTEMPDMAYVTIGVTTQNKDMQTAQDNNAQTMNSMFESLKSAGLSDDDMRTTQYNAYPIYDYSNDIQKIISYEVTNQAELTIKDIGRVGEIIDIAVNNGANMINEIRFGLLDEQSRYNEALKLAVEAARAKADTLAMADGVKIIGTLQITENTLGGDISREYELASLYDAAGSTPISTGDLDVMAGITVVYEIE